MNKQEQIGLAEVVNDYLAVDKVVDNTSEIKIIKGKAKILTIDVDEEWIENSFIDLPFIYYYQSKEPIYMIEYKWKSNDGLERAIQVRSSIHGIPTPFEYDVLLALLRIFIRNNNDRIIIGKKVSNMINFTFRELSKEMGFKGFGGKTKARLEKAIETLCDTNIYNTMKGGLYDTISKTYVTDAKMIIGILHNYTGYSYINTSKGVVLDKSSLKDKVSVGIDEFFLNNITAGKGKISNKTLRQSLKIDVARRIYLIINKWRNNRSEMYITYKKLYERIPLDNSKTVSYRNNRIRVACKELVNKDFLYDFSVEKEGIIFKFINKNKSLSDTTPIEKYKTYSALNNGLLKYGFTYEDIDKYLQLDKVQLCQCVLRYVDEHLNTIKEPKFYIIGCLIKGNNDILKDKRYNS